MAVYEVYGEGDTSQRRIDVEVYGRYVNNGVSIVVGSEGENLVTELAFFGVPEIGNNQIVTMKWYAETEGTTVGDAQMLVKDPDSGKWVAAIQRGLSQYNHADAYIQVDAEGRVWRSYAFRMIFAQLPGDDAPQPDVTIIDQVLAELNRVLNKSEAIEAYLTEKSGDWTEAEAEREAAERERAAAEEERVANETRRQEELTQAINAAEGSAEDAEAWAKGTRDGSPVSGDDPAYHDNAKWWSDEAADSATDARNAKGGAEAAQTAANGSAEDAEAWAKGTRDGQAVGDQDPTYHKNAKHWADEADGSAAAADGSAEDAEAWAKGTRDGSDVGSGDPAYHNHAKWWSGQAEGSAEDAEAWAKGTRDGSDVGSGDPAYHDNAKYWSGVAGEHATAADGSAEDAEAWSKGTRDGQAVGDQDPTYHDNAKYWNDQAGGSATAAEGSAEDAEAWAKGTRDGQAVGNQDPAYHNHAKYWAEEAGDRAEDAEAWAKGTRGGQDVGSGDETYHDNAKYWADEAKNTKEAVDELVDGIAQEETAESIEAKLLEAVDYLKDIAENGTGGSLNGFSLTLDPLGRVHLSYVNPEDETDTAEEIFATDSTASKIADEWAGINASLRLITQSDETEGEP